ncbi:MAG: 2-oxo acid dehydrogenase subunit E2, partial [Betaproteobacteria bacterium]|nr:2-oxo acid dehydrogenase subunit E2 [Betaproteobacteria bacterium]
MLVDVKVPQLSESVAEATLVSWHKKTGEFVKRDENLVDIETDKVVLETPAPQAGVLVKIVKTDGGTVTSNEIIAQIDTDAKADGKPGAQAAEAKAPAVQEAVAAAPAVAAQGKTAGSPAMPSAQKIAAEKNIDTGTISGTGRGGRVTKGDVLQAAQGGGAGAPAAGPAAAPARVTPSVDLDDAGQRPEQRVPMSRLRARIAERLVQSQATAAILTTFNEVNMQPVIDMRNRYKERFEKEHGVKLGFMSFFVKAAVHALKKYPLVNASIDGNDIVYHGYYDIGIAVGSP